MPLGSGSRASCCSRSGPRRSLRSLHWRCAMRDATTDGRLDEIRAIAEYAMGRSHAYSRSRVVSALREMIERHDRYREALAEIIEARESFVDDRTYANHAERVAYNAINRSAS